MNYLSERDPQLTTQELEIIEYFAQGQKYSCSSRNLNLEFTETSLRLSNSSGKLIGIAKQTNEWQRKVLISNTSVYRAKIVEALLGRGYITRKKSSHLDFTEYHYYRVPKGYRLNYTETMQLWKIWWHNKRDRLNAPNSSIDMPIFIRGNWYPVQELQPRQGNFVIQTAIGEIKFAPEDYIIWLDRIASNSVNPAARTEPNPRSERPVTEVSRVPGSSIDSAKRTPHERVESPGPEEDLDLESYLSTFNTADTADVDRIDGIYNIGELLNNANQSEDPSPTAPDRVLSQTKILTSATVLEPLEPTDSPEPPLPSPVVDPAPLSPNLQQQQSLKTKAMNVLAKYLAEGDLVTLTEVLKNANGREIERKVTTIQHGCPRWAIEQVQKLD